MKANEEELQIINEFKNSLGSGNSELQPVVKVSDEKMIGYYPILTNGLCLQCHGGVGEEITEDVSAKLKELFPKDSAVGYAAGELRGLWVVKEK